MLVEIGSVFPLSQDWVTVGLEGCAKSCKWGDDKLPFKNGEVSLVYAEHALDLLWWYQTKWAVGEVFRVLQPSGIFEVWVTDFGLVVDSLRTKRCGDGWRDKNKKGDYMTWVQGKIYGSPLDSHKACFTFLSLKKLLQAAGFKKVKRIIRPRRWSDSKTDLGMMGIK